MTAAARVLEALGQTFRELAGPLLAPLVEGLAEPLEDTDTRFALTPRGWAQVYDLNTTPDPAWLGQAIGARIPAGLTVEQARSYISDRAYWRRGTPEAMRGALQPLLVGQRRVHFVERDGSPWALTVRVYEGEVAPGVTFDDLKAAAETQKPVGIVLTLDLAPSATYAHFADEHGPTYADVADDFPTYEAASSHVPEEGTTP